MRCHQLKRAIDAILNLMPKEIRGKLFTPNVHMDAIHIRSLFLGSDLALIGSQPSRRCATGRLSCADDRRCPAPESSVAVQMQGGCVSTHAAAIATVQAGLRSILYSITHSILYTHVSVVN